ncbi:ribosomal protein S18-alanine N-acetyltransferase [Marinobacter sp. SS21]|uniref:ribosomal protein S18-alanine N-acetyltransferase n=1 Tax=Marinobacter sp. SS21 TaxID=2979460 RepID=UPI00232CE110|nr:ribosomal protein S18-alanine N-acetyltransferase [Marinobacter sp. SS21]MDC0664102.1 ribosomal protein S18-alanine N-acetyltransferase [Marinobacter sp. SS21]
MEDSDFPAVLDMERRSYSHPWTESTFQSCLLPNYRLWLLLDGDALAGYAVVCYQVDEAHLLNICIAPNQRRRGAGRWLLRHIAACAAHDGMAMVLLEVRVSNLNAIGLYASEGFQEIGERPGYYPAVQGRENAKVMKLTLAAS